MLFGLSDSRNLQSLLWVASWRLAWTLACPLVPVAPASASASDNALLLLMARISIPVRVLATLSFIDELMGRLIRYCISQICLSFRLKCELNCGKANKIENQIQIEIQIQIKMAQWHLNWLRICGQKRAKAAAALQTWPIVARLLVACFYLFITTTTQTTIAC